MPMPFFDPLRFGTEFAYTLIIVILCFIIYFKTRDIYNLTSYKGIEHFRNAFLFFGLAYITRFIFQIFILSRITLNFFFRLRGISEIMLVLTGYFSTMAIFYLVYAAIWKKMASKDFFLIANIIAVILSLMTFFFRSPILVGVLQIALLICAIVFSYWENNKSKRFTKIKVLYFLVLIFWFFNLFIVSPRRMLHLEIQIAMQILSLIVFMIIYYKVHKWTK